MCICGVHIVDCIIQWAINLIVQYHVSDVILQMRTAHQTPRIGQFIKIQFDIKHSKKFHDDKDGEKRKWLFLKSKQEMA